VVKRILLLFKPYKKKIIAIIICTLVSSGIGMMYPLISKQLTDYGLMKSNLNIVIKFSLISLFLILVDQGIGMIETKYRSYLSAKMPYDLSKSAFKHLLKLKAQYFNNINFSEIMSNIGMDVGNISRVSDRSTFFIVLQIFRIIGGLIGLLIINWKLTILVVAVIPFRYILVKYLANARKKSFEMLMEYNKDYAGWYQK